MRRLFFSLALAVCFATVSFAARVETIPFRAILSSANEIPTNATGATGAVNIWVHLVRDDAGAITSGSVDFNVTYRFAASPNFVAMHIHKGAANQNGSVVIDSALPRLENQPAVGALPARQAQFGSSGDAFDAVNGLLANPDQYYFNVHTTDFPAGVMRGQVQRADRGVFIGQMSPANENPPVAPLVAANSSGIGSVTILRTFDSGGNLTSGWIAFDVNYVNMPAGTRFIAMHVHTGVAGLNGPVTLDSAMTGVDVPESGGGNLHFENELDTTRPAVADALNRVFLDPQSFYINAHTTAAPGGAIRSQLRSTDRMEFQLTLSPANENPPLTIAASTIGRIEMRTIRNADGTAAAAVVVFDANTRFPAGTNFTATHIHDQVAGQNGPVTVDSALVRDALLVADGTGNIYKQVTISSASALSSLNDCLINPEKHYWNLHSVANPGGAVRAQLAGPPVAPNVGLVISAVTDIARATGAPGSLMRLFGNNLVREGTNLDGFLAPNPLPTSLNGTSVTVGGVAAPILAAVPTEMVVQVPVEVTGTSAQVVVKTPGGSSTAQAMPVATAAPNVFFDGTGGLILKNADYSLVRPANAARAGEAVLIYATGLGQTTPPLTTGRIVPDATYRTPAVKVTIGGTEAIVIYSLASPGFVGLSQTAVTIPAGLKAGNQPLVLSVGSVTSNTVQIAVQ